jgi:hypothetical protein
MLGLTTRLMFRLPTRLQPLHLLNRRGNPSVQFEEDGLMEFDAILVEGLKRHLLEARQYKA